MTSKSNWKVNDLEEYIRSGKFKEGLGRCDTWLKKDPKNSGLLLCKATLLTQLGRMSESLKIYNDLCRRQPPITDVEQIKQIQHCVVDAKRVAGESLSSGEDIDYLWQTAIKTKKDGRTLCEEWFKICAITETWQDAQKALILLRKYAPKDPQYLATYIAVSQLLAEIHPSPTSRKMCGDLAYKFIMLLVNKTPKDPKATKSDMFIHSMEELRLLIRIYRKQDRCKELLAILESPHIGITSNIARHGWEFVQTKLQLLEEEEMWTELLDSCRTLLQEGDTRIERHKVGDVLPLHHEGDDWAVWKRLVLSTTKLNSADSTEMTRRFIDGWISAHPRSRNASMASLHLLEKGTTRPLHCQRTQEKGHPNMVVPKLESHPSSQMRPVKPLANGEQFSYSSSAASVPSKTPEASAQTATSLLDACMQHSSRFCKTPSCFEDLRNFVETLEREAQNAFRRHASSLGSEWQPSSASDESVYSQWLTVEMNSLKFDYLLCISGAQLDSKAVVEGFVSNCIGLYSMTISACATESVTDASSGGEACLLAVMGLAKLHHFRADEQDGSNKYLLQAAYLLEHLLERAEHSYQAKLILVHIYLSLGLGSLAMRWYHRLGLKEIQHDTLSHVLYTRISSSHPFPVSRVDRSYLGDDETDPYVGMGKALRFHDGSSMKIVTIQSQVLENNNYDQLYELRDLKVALEHSFTKRLMGEERRRIARLRGLVYEDAEHKAASDVSLNPPTLLRDSRDFTSTISFEPSGSPRFEETISGMGKPSRPTKLSSTQTYWLTMVSTMNSIYKCLLQHKPVPDLILTRMSEEPIPPQRGELMDCETNAKVAWAHVGAAVTCMFGVNADRNIEHPMQRMQEWLDQQERHYSPARRKVSGTLPGGESLHSLFLTLDVLKTYAKFCEVATARSKEKSQKMSEKTVKVQTTGLSTGIEKLHAAVQSHASAWLNALTDERERPWMELVCSGAVGEALERLVGLKELTQFAVRINESARDAVEGVLHVRLTDGRKSGR
ncbi:hypothetical protein B0A49_07987 [Cryomyces minteri]|uniref:Uncharacterized protein n=1 Tax=Cryomyces minteri TaxID=331657 RepID=A0A4U0WNC1_9PEZI|nr:hypothetical protein B0A49_07987 [Cryomyces minteri]